MLLGMEATTTVDGIEVAAHPFAHFGQSPYRVLKTRESVKFQACHGAPVQSCDSCDVCGQSIQYVVEIKTACGRVFKAGQDCALKAAMTADSVAEWQRRIVADVKRWQAKMAKQKRTAKQEAAIEHAKKEHAPLLLVLADLIDASDDGEFQHSFCSSVRAQILRGKPPSEKQIAVIARLA
jgi:hypothetical protein